MSDRTTLLFALPQYRVLDVTPEPGGGRRVLVESIAEQGGCPACGVLSSVIRDRPVSRVKDLPHGLVSLLVYVRKRRFVCTQVLCERRSFTETTAELPARVKQWNNDPKPFVWKANAEDIIEKVQRGRAALTRQINSTTDD